MFYLRFCAMRKIVNKNDKIVPRQLILKPVLISKTVVMSGYEAQPVLSRAVQIVIGSIAPIICVCLDSKFCRYLRQDGKLEKTKDY